MHPHLARVVERNIKTLLEMRRQMEKRRKFPQRVADGITSVSGSLPFLYLNITWFMVWIAINTGLVPGVAIFDPFPFGLLTTIVSLEAIILSTLVLVTQNRIADVSEQRADLDLQINILTEYELTKVLKLTDAIADHLGLKEGMDSELEDLKREIHPTAVLQEMERRKKELGLANGK